MLRDIRHYEANLATSVIVMYGSPCNNDTVVYGVPFSLWEMQFGKCLGVALCNAVKENLVNLESMNFFLD